MQWHYKKRTIPDSDIFITRLHVLVTETKYNY